MKTKNRPASWAKLATQLGFSRRALTDWRKLPGAPQEPVLASWKAFVSDNALGTMSGNRVSRDREKLLVENLVKRNRLLDHEFAVKQGKVVDRAAVNKLLLHVSSQQRAVMFAALEREYPGKVVGRTAAEISLIGRELGDRICCIMQSAIESWISDSASDPS